MNGHATIKRLLHARDYCFVGLLTAQMEGKQAQEGYWAMQFDVAQEALREACERAGVPFPVMQQLPLFLSGDGDVTFVRSE